MMYSLLAPAIPAIPAIPRETGGRMAQGPLIFLLEVALFVFKNFLEKLEKGAL